MKKTYITPAMSVVEMDTPHLLISNSIQPSKLQQEATFIRMERFELDGDASDAAAKSHSSSLWDDEVEE